MAGIEAREVAARTAVDAARLAVLNALQRCREADFGSSYVLSPLERALEELEGVGSVLFDGVR